MRSTVAPRPWEMLRDQLSAGLASEVPALLTLHKVPGAQIAVGFRRRVILSAAFGMADPAHSSPVTTGTIFKAASIAKAVTALCVLRLVDRGRIELDAPFEHYTDWRLPPDRRHGHDPRGVTIRRLLSHSSGLDAAKFPQLPAALPAPSARDILDGFFGPELTPNLRSPPGSELKYAGSNFEVLRLVLESVCREPIAVIAAREVLTPLGLSSTFMSPLDLSQYNAQAVAHEESGQAVPDLYYPAVGSSGLYTTASDLARLWLAIGGAPLGDETTILSPALCADMLSPQASMPNGYAYGLGVALARYGHRTIFKHAGIARGLFSLAEGTPGGCVVVMTNSGDNAKGFVMPLVGRLTASVIEALDRRPPSPPTAHH